jgi:hypothetical protein
MVDIFLELSKFNFIKYYDEPHKYYINDEPTISCTGFIHHFVDDFEEGYLKPDNWGKKQGYIYECKSMADRFANKLNFYPKEGDPYGRPDYSKPKPFELHVTEEEIQKLWDYENHHATYEGSTLHDFIENYISNKVKPIPKVSPEGILFEEIEPTFNVMKNHFLNFYNDSITSGRLIPIKSEFIVGDEELMLCGMVDQIFWNVKYQCLQIWDWKTNTELRMKNDFGNKMKHSLWFLDDCEFNHYSLQLSIYKKLIEKNTNLKFGDSYLVWFNELNDNYKIIKTDDYSNYVDKMFKQLKTNRSLFIKNQEKFII